MGSPSEAAFKAAFKLVGPVNPLLCRDVADALDAAVQKERAAVVKALRIGALLYPDSQLGRYADAIERGEHAR